MNQTIKGRRNEVGASAPEEGKKGKDAGSACYFVELGEKKGAQGGWEREKSGKSRNAPPPLERRAGSGEQGEASLSAGNLNTRHFF